LYTIRQLEIFLSLCKSEKVKDVATEFNMSQSAVSMSIKELEKIVSQPLFDRVGKRLVVNDRGRYLYDNTHILVTNLRTVFTNFNEYKDSGNIKIFASLTIANYWLAPIISSFSTHYKNAHFNIHASNTKEVLAAVHEGVCDVGFVEGTVKDLDTECIDVQSDKLIFVTSDREFASQPRQLSELFEHEWILREEGSATRDIFIEMLGSQSKLLTIAYELEQYESIKQFLLHNPSLISCIPYISVAMEIEQEALFSIDVLDVNLYRSFKMVFRHEKQMTPLLERFKQYVIHNVSDD